MGFSMFLFVQMQKKHKEREALLAFDIINESVMEGMNSLSSLNVPI